MSPVSTDPLGSAMATTRASAADPRCAAARNMPARRARCSGGADRKRRTVQTHSVQLQEVLSRYGSSNARVFGNVARGAEDAGSDVDLLVDVPGGVGLVTLGRCQAELEGLLGARVDLVPARDLKPGVAVEVLVEAVPL